MKIQNNGSSGSAPLENPRTQPLASEITGGGLGQSISGHDGDSVAISGLSSQVAGANASDSSQRANRVAELAALHARGSYQLSANKLSNAMVSQALGLGGEA